MIGAQSVRFPTMVKPDAVETTGNPHIEAAWFDGGLRAALKDAKLHSGATACRSSSGMVLRQAQHERRRVWSAHAELVEARSILTRQS
ncbi:MAG: hypothetical protein JO290_01705 [Sphingomonadaceae bacterium]|nr:hypothetical protein [Sphingomonadaceae bacterium]